MEDVELPQQAGGDLGRIPAHHVLRGQVGGDHRPPVAQQPGVDKLVQGGLGELGGELAAQVVQNQQVAVEVPPGLCPVGLPPLRVPLKLPVLKLGEDVPGGVVHHREPLLRHAAGNAGGQERLAQAGSPGEKQVFKVEAAELLGIVETHLVHQLHVLPGGGAPFGPEAGAVIVHPEGVEGLLPQIQQLGQLPDLLLGAQLFQTLAHLGPPPAGVPALGAGGLVVQGVLGQAQGPQQHRPLLLDLQILVPKFVMNMQEKTIG